MTTNSTPASLTYSDGIGSRGRRPFLILIKGESITTFKGETIPGVVVVRGTDYNKNGKWSHTTFRLELAQGVRAVSGSDGWETGKFVEGLRSAVSASKPIDTWADVANALGVSVPSAMSFLREWRPKAAVALDEVDAQLTALDEAADKVEAKADTETVVVSFGSPTRAQRADGFWTSAKGIPNHNGELRLINKEKGWIKENIKVAGIVGTVMSASHASGYGGGYVSVTVAVVPGTSFEDPEPKAPMSEEELVERTRLADLLAWDPYPGAPASRPLGDLALAQRIDAFVKEAVGVRGQQTFQLLREEADEAYGRGGRSIAIAEKFPGVDHHGLDWAAGRDIMPVTFWAEKLSANAPKPPKDEVKPASTEQVTTTLDALTAKFGGGRRR
ncbi:MAG: hypothetical protein AAB386_00500 [Patescibacteria group bacterium]